MSRRKKPAVVFDAAAIMVTLRERHGLDTIALADTLGLEDVVGLEEFLAGNASASTWALDAEGKWQARRTGPGQATIPGTDPPMDVRIADEATRYRDALVAWQGAAAKMNEAKSVLEKAMADQDIEDTRVPLDDGTVLLVWIQKTTTRKLCTKVERNKPLDDSE